MILFSAIVFNIVFNIAIIFLAKVNADKIMTEEPYKVTSRLNYIQFHNSYHTIKIKSCLLRHMTVGFKFCKKSGMSIINSVIYKI